LDNQKRENLLNFALDATDEERERSVELGVGFDNETRLWEVIVRYVGDILQYREAGIEVAPLLGNYAILRLSEEQLDYISDLPEIAYIEKPKRLFFADAAGRAASCVDELQLGNIPDGISGLPQLYGRGVVIAVADSGIDVLHPAFRNADGTTRILRIWDQTKTSDTEYPAPFDYDRGTEYTAEQINELIRAFEAGEIRRNDLPATDNSGHGTAVAGVATGSADFTEGDSQNLRRARGVAPASDIIVVKMGVPSIDSFPRTTELMLAVDYCVRTGIALNLPTVINLSIGNTYGSHDGTSLLETYLDTVSDLGRTTIVIGSGNEGATAGHTFGVLRNNVAENVELAVTSFETKLSLQIWKNYADEFGIVIEAPGGTSVGPFESILGMQQFLIENTNLLLYYGEPSPYSSAQEIYIEFIPADETGYISGGIWNIRLVPRRIVDGEYHMWLPESPVLNANTRFLRPTTDTTLTIPSTAEKVITVGAYDSSLLSYADFSGRGYTRVITRVKPELVAPGVNIFTAASGGGFTTVSGTSFATPFVSGAAALLMEWGIVNGNDSFLYGEKVKAFLIRGARPLPGFSLYPNPQLGWGALCVVDSIPQ